MLLLLVFCYHYVFSLWRNKYDDDDDDDVVVVVRQVAIRSRWSWQRELRTLKRRSSVDDPTGWQTSTRCVLTPWTRSVSETSTSSLLTAHRTGTISDDDVHLCVCLSVCMFIFCLSPRPRSRRPTSVRSAVTKDVTHVSSPVKKNSSSMAQMTCFRPRMVLLGVRTTGDVIRGNLPVADSAT